MPRIPPVVKFSSMQIELARGERIVVDPQRPYAFLVEEERSASGEVVAIATLFLTNRECSFRCLMCDLWKNTTIEPVPPGAIPAQIDFALSQLPVARQIKLYNSGNFFDPLAIPRCDYKQVVARVQGFDNVIVENHPRLCGNDCLGFKELLNSRSNTRLEVALGLETIHPVVLPLLNKQMTVSDFDRATTFLTDNEIAVRTFILLRPPLLGEAEGIEWALRSIEHAFDAGASCCSVIATRSGNGIMERLEANGAFSAPSLDSLEAVLVAGLRLGRGRVFVDLWNIEQLCRCPRCGPVRVERLRRMNLSQQPEPPVACNCR